MRHVIRSIQSEESIAPIERTIASLDDVFALTNEYEVQRAEATYLGGAPEPKAVQSV